MENAPVVPEMGTIELRAFRCQSLSDEEFYIKECDGLHQGHVSERTKMAGWHQVRYYIAQAACPILIHV
jgi:hypothetical protein